MRRWILAALGVALSGTAQGQDAEEEPVNDGVGLSVDYAELRPRGGNVSLFFDGSVQWRHGDDALILKASTDVPLAAAFSGVEIQLRASHDLSPAATVFAGARKDFAAGGMPVMALAGVSVTPLSDTSAEAVLFLSPEGDAFGRAEAMWNAQLDERLVLQPKVEVNWAWDTSESGPAGPIGMAAALRLMHQTATSFTPYVGLIHERALARYALMAREGGNPVSRTVWAVGVSASF